MSRTRSTIVALIVGFLVLLASKAWLFSRRSIPSLRTPTTGTTPMGSTPRSRTSVGRPGARTSLQWRHWRFLVVFWVRALGRDYTSQGTRLRPPRVVHAEQDVLRQAGDRQVMQLFSEREPCAARCGPLTEGIPTRGRGHGTRPVFVPRRMRLCVKQFGGSSDDRH